MLLLHARSLSTLSTIVLVGMGIAVIPVLTIFMFNDDNSLTTESCPLEEPMLAPQKDTGAPEALSSIRSTLRDAMLGIPCCFLEVFAGRCGSSCRAVHTLRSAGATLPQMLNGVLTPSGQSPVKSRHTFLPVQRLGLRRLRLGHAGCVSRGGQCRTCWQPVTQSMGLPQALQ